MLLRQIALVSKSQKITFRQLASVSAALQKQATRDFSPIWEVSATVDPFAMLEDVPLGYWPIIVEDDIDDPGAAGVHEDRMGQPFALVKTDPTWSLTASHECLEMLADPFGNRVVAGNSPTLASRGKSSRKSASKARKSAETERVEFLVEVCDPCEDPQFAYAVDDIPVSDFYTPEYFAAAAGASGRYDLQGHISSPRQVLPNGYLSWRDSRGRWWQQTYFKKKQQIAPLAAKLNDYLGLPNFNLRSAVDRATPTPFEEAVTSGGGPLGITIPDGGGQDLQSVLSDGGGAQGVRHVVSLFRKPLLTGKLLSNLEGYPQWSRWLGAGRKAAKTSPDMTLQQDATAMERDIERAKEGKI